MIKQIGWTNNPEASKLHQSILNNNWREFPVSIGTLERLPESPGLYIYFCSPKNCNETIFSQMKTIMYVGMASVSLKQRFKSHFRKPKFLKARETYGPKFKYACLQFSRESETFNELKQMEQSIINFFGPPLNEINSVRNDAISGIIK